jgi:hypothetical protein
MMTEFTEAQKQITNETQELLVSLDEKQNELTEYQTNVVNIRKYASDLQTYLAVKQIEKEVVSPNPDDTATLLLSLI